MYSNPDTAIILGNQALAILNEAENFSKVSNFEKVWAILNEKYNSAILEH